MFKMVEGRVFGSGTKEGRRWRLLSMEVPMKSTLQFSGDCWLGQGEFMPVFFPFLGRYWSTVCTGGLVVVLDCG
jgi:hypothetical protein